MTFFDMETALTGERTMTKDTGGRRRPSRDEIAALAYQLYEKRGRQDGEDLGDWLASERELLRRSR